jgi:hypothetical protein
MFSRCNEDSCIQEIFISEKQFFLSGFIDQRLQDPLRPHPGKFRKNLSKMADRGYLAAVGKESHVGF